MIKIILIAVLGLIALVFLLDRVNQRKIESLRRRGIYPLAGQESEADIERLIQMNRKIEAIKVYRTVHGVDLKTPKQAIDKLASEMRQYKSP